MTAAEVQRLRDGKLIEVGSHTNSHPVLSQLPLDTQREEISGSKSLLEDILGQPITSFAYPYGDFDAKTREAVKRAGFTLACSIKCGPVVNTSDLFALPRVHIANWDGDAFEQALHSA